MARQRKTSVQLILKPGHLQAIGQVASQWTSFEIQTMLVLASVLEVDLRKALILAKGLGVLAWLDMIKSYLIKPDLELNKIIAASQRLSGERNNIVHAYWQDSRPKSGLPSLVKSKSA